MQIIEGLGFPLPQGVMVEEGMPAAEPNETARSGA